MHHSNGCGGAQIIILAGSPVAPTETATPQRTAASPRGAARVALEGGGRGGEGVMHEGGTMGVGLERRREEGWGGARKD